MSEIIAGPFDVYFAPAQTAAPTITEQPGTVWRKIGHTAGGVKVGHPQTVVELRSDQVTGPLKAVRSEESCEIGFAIESLTLENYALALNQAINGPTGDTVKLYRGGFQVETLALLCRNDHLSPLGDYPLQYTVPICYQADNPSVDFTKDAAAVLACSFHALVDPDASPGEEFGYLEAGDA